jgi:hypothetical protein
MTRLAHHLGLIAIVYTLVILFLGFAAGRASAHDPYSSWMMPDAPHVSCCHKRDCRPVRAIQGMDGGWTAIVDGQLVPVPKAKIMTIPSPDGRSHWCGQGGMTYCFLPGQVRM